MHILGTPPFSLRPSLPHASHSTPSPRHADPTNIIPQAQTQVQNHNQTLSPLYSSSSSSETPADESYLHLDTLDPFSRFWGALENMLDDISKPVAFASIPVDLPLVGETLGRDRGTSRGKRKEGTTRIKGKDKGEDAMLMHFLFVVECY